MCLKTDATLAQVQERVLEWGRAAFAVLEQSVRTVILDSLFASAFSKPRYLVAALSC